MTDNPSHARLQTQHSGHAHAVLKILGVVARRVVASLHIEIAYYWYKMSAMLYRSGGACISLYTVWNLPIQTPRATHVHTLEPFGRCIVTYGWVLRVLRGPVR